MEPIELPIFIDRVPTDQYMFARWQFGRDLDRISLRNQPDVRQNRS